MIAKHRPVVSKVQAITVLVAALGYFVDVYDLTLFLVIGKASIADLYPAWKGTPMVLEQFQYLLNVQMLGMLVGGLVWGVMGDKKGRLAVLFGSIFLYSLANFANAFVTDMNAYAALRFVAGVGLAGELGAGVCLVVELMDRNRRGIGTMLIASVGMVGAVAAAFISATVTWQMAYIIGGCLGFVLLVLRVGLLESAMFASVHRQPNLQHGNFLMMFQSWERFGRFASAILLGLPTWFVIGLLIARAPEIAKILGVQGDIAQNICIMVAYAGLVVGDLVAGAASQLFRSRKKSFLLFYVLCSLMMFAYLRLQGVSSLVFYIAVCMLGFTVGFWAIFVTNASEQFGTNLRATAAISIPNFARGALVPIAWVFTQVFQHYDKDMIKALSVVGVGVMIITFVTLYSIKETFDKDLDYCEH